MEWFFTPQNGIERAVDDFDWELHRYNDASRPSSGKVTVKRNEAIFPKNWVRAVEDGQTRFLGFVCKRPGIKGATQIVEVNGVENLLWKRKIGSYGYMPRNNGNPFIRFCHIFSSNAPVDLYDIYGIKGAVGLLWRANSRIAPGVAVEQTVDRPFPYAGRDNSLIAYGPWIQWDNTNGVYRLPGAGTKSRLGTAAFYINGSPMTEQATMAALKAASVNSIFRTETDLYIRYYENGWYLGGQNNDFFGHNVNDTHVSLGQLDNADAVLEGPLVTAHTNIIGDALVGIANMHELTPRYRYENDWRCYMDVLEDFEDDDVFDIKEPDCDSIDFSMPSDLEPDALIGLGYGSQHCQQTYSVVSWAPGNAYIEDTYEIENGFRDSSGLMHNILSEKWESYSNREIVKITSNKYNHLLPHNPIDLYLNSESKKSYQVAQISRYKKKPSEISLGNRDYDILDSIEARREVSDIYDEQYLFLLQESKTNGNITVGDLDSVDTPFTTAALTMPASTLKTNNNAVVVLHVGITVPNNTPIEPSFCTFWVCVGTSTTNLDNMSILDASTQWYKLGDTVEGMNITPWITWGVGNYIRVHCRFRGYYATLPVMTCSVNLQIYGRRNIV